MHHIRIATDSYLHMKIRVLQSVQLENTKKFCNKTEATTFLGEFNCTHSSRSWSGALVVARCRLRPWADPGCSSGGSLWRRCWGPRWPQPLPQAQQLPPLPPPRQASSSWLHAGSHYREHCSDPRSPEHRLDQLQVREVTIKTGSTELEVRFLISDFRRDLNIVYLHKIPCFLSHLTLYTQPLKMELIQGSETSANYNLTPGKYPEENMQ